MTAIKGKLRHIFSKGIYFNNDKKEKHIPIRRYWTRRYLFTLCIGLIVVMIISALWIRHQTMENRLKVMSLLAENIAEQIVVSNQNNSRLTDFFYEKELKTKLDIDPFTYIVDTEGTIISSNPPTGPLSYQLDESIMENDDAIGKFMENDQVFYVVKSPIEFNDSVIGWVVLIETKDKLTHVNQEYTQLIIMIISIALLGWAAIYVLSNRLARPIKEVSEAAKLVSEGNYNILIPFDSKEKEVHELIHSFKEMAQKLEKLESLRTELLAGVTHELKTPVTSISGLLQALRDGVVTGDEAKEFLNISLNEAEKMKTMVEDLLVFNQFATNAVPLNAEVHDMNEIMEDAITSWQIAQQDDEIEIELLKLQKPVEVYVDSIRLQQIMTNLLNNAKQAMDNKGMITVSLEEDESTVHIDVIDTGCGIPEEEQKYIFERFFRGEEKKHKFRGLGLGLALSKMIAQAMGGDLLLVKSSKEGTNFRILFPKYAKEMSE